MKKLLLIFLPFLFLCSCSTDFDITGDWQDITVVYGLLDQTDSVSYLKINKAFLGEGDVLMMAAEEDSSSYGSALEVKIEEWYNGVKEKDIFFDTTTVYNKEPGVFYYPKQVVYKAPTLQELEKEKLYKLVITNKNTGKQITSQTELVYPIPKIEKPASSVKFMNFTNLSVNPEVAWKSSKNGRKYQLVIRFNFKELPASGGTDTVYKYVDWVFNPIRTNFLDGTEELSLHYSNALFFSLLQSKIFPNPEIKRFFGKKGYGSTDFGAIEFIFSVAADDLSTYLDVTAPSTSIVQEKPDYTNITNGIGLFSARYHQTRSFKLDERTADTLKILNLGF